MATELEQHNGQFAQLCQTAGAIADNLEKLYQETLANNRSDIARLAVEIARKILHAQGGPRRLRHPGHRRGSSQTCAQPGRTS